MKILDRYLLRQFVQTFLICFLSLAGLYIVIDAFSNMDEFVRYAKEHGSLLKLLGEFYGYRAIFFFDRTSGVLALVAAMFTVTWLQQSNELTAISAAGVPTRRIIVPVILAAASISLVAALGRESVIPAIRGELGRSPKNLGGEIAQELKPRYDNETDILFRGRDTVAKNHQVRKPNLLLPPGLDRLGRQLMAQDAYYKPPTKERPGGYLLDHVTAPLGMDHEDSLLLGKRPIVITPQDADWLKKDQCFVVSEVSFEQLTGGSQWRQFSSTADLIRGIHNPSLDFGADVRVAIHARIVQPLLDINLLLLGIPLVIGRENRNVFLAIGLCVIVVSVFMLVVLACQYLGAIYLLPPAMAAWLPLMIFIPLAAWLSDVFWI